MTNVVDLGVEARPGARRGRSGDEREHRVRRGAHGPEARVQVEVRREAARLVVAAQARDVPDALGPQDLHGRAESRRTLGAGKGPRAKEICLAPPGFACGARDPSPPGYSFKTNEQLGRAIVSQVETHHSKPNFINFPMKNCFCCLSSPRRASKALHVDETHATGGLPLVPLI